MVKQWENGSGETLVLGLWEAGCLSLMPAGGRDKAGRSALLGVIHMHEACILASPAAPWPRWVPA